MPVVIELFTSEGCSSCPPADEVLIRLVSTQPVAGAQIIALGEHVDYWDQLGWRDAFSSATFSRRQTEYADRVFRSGNIYTPQLVINGHQEVVGSDYRGAVAVVENGLTTKVARGENGGRTLQHSAVVRTMRDLAPVDSSSSAWSGRFPVALAAEWNRSKILFVAFVQDRSSREILGAAAVRP